jgi:hypothetical protein
MDLKTLGFLERAGDRTVGHARQNIEKWGLQDLKTLIVVATEELGETAKEVLDYEHPKERPLVPNRHGLDMIRREAMDFAAVGLQIMALVEKLQSEVE